MKLIQNELPLILTANCKDEDNQFEWIIHSMTGDKPKITLDYNNILDRLLSIPLIKKPLINRTTLESPFYGESYKKLFKDDTPLHLIPFKEDGYGLFHTYSEHFTQTNALTPSEHISIQKLINSTLLGGMANSLLSSDFSVYAGMSLGVIVGTLSMVLNYGQTEKMIFEKILDDLGSDKDDFRKINVDHILDNMNELINDPVKIKSALLSDIDKKNGHNSSAKILESLIDLESVSGEINADSMYATMTAKTPLFIERMGFPFYSDTTSKINIIGKNISKQENIVLDSSFEKINPLKLYILIKNKEEQSKLFDIINRISTFMPDRFALKKYSEILDFCGYIVDGNFVDILTDQFYQSHIKDSGLMLKAEIDIPFYTNQICGDKLDKTISDVQKTISQFEELDLTAEAVYFDGKTMYDKNDI
ncbi:MAG: hypothetical protein GQ477_02415 [Nanohaloarchaea archaeon]|nr:hypothetical protein [Candidatus Nanohaloarchaea archaeon]